jgi:hypothetical protein
MKSLFDPTFRYVPSVDTDIRKTFERIKEEARQLADAREHTVAARLIAAPPQAFERTVAR